MLQCSIELDTDLQQYNTSNSLLLFPPIDTPFHSAQLIDRQTDTAPSFAISLTCDHEETHTDISC